MKVYRDLIIRGSRQALDSFIASVTEHASGGWVRQLDREARVSKAALGRMYCFVRDGTEKQPAFELWVSTDKDGSLYVSNILTENVSPLSFDQYNDVLADFQMNCAAPAARGAGVEIELTDPNPQLEDFVSERTAKILRAFSGIANRSFLHPLDDKRWNEFLVSAYRENAKLEGTMLRRWLIEEEHWPEDAARRLEDEYERARSLLETYESLPA